MKNHQIGLLSPEQRKFAINEIMRFFENEREEKIGMIGAEEALDMFLDSVGKMIYNQAIIDAGKFFKEKVDSLDFEMETVLQK